MVQEKCEKNRKRRTLWLRAAALVSVGVIAGAAIFAPVPARAENISAAVLSASGHSLNVEEPSYWELSIIPNGDGAPVSETYYVCLDQEIDSPWHAKIVSDTGDDLVTGIYAWSYDQGSDTVTVGLLQNPWDSGVFTYQNGVYFCQGTYRRLVLTASADAKENFLAAESSFVQNYGGYHPVQRLLRLTQHDGYYRYPETDAPDAAFKFLATFHSFGVIKPEEEAYIQKISRELAAHVMPEPDGIHANEVLLGVEYPTEGSGDPTIRATADVINLVYKNVNDAQKAYTKLWMETGSQLLDSGAPTGDNAAAADWGEACFFWNETQAAAIFRISGSVVIFRGPVKDVQTMTRFLNLCDYLWS